MISAHGGWPAHRYTPQVTQRRPGGTEPASTPPQRPTPARKGARCGAGAGSPSSHRPHPGHTGHRTPAARPRGRAAGGGTAPDTRRPSQRWQAIPPLGTAPHHCRGTQPPQGMQAKGTVLSPQTHTRAPTACDLRTPTARQLGRQFREGERLTTDAPQNSGRHPPRGRPFATPTASNAGPHIARCGDSAGSHARTDRTRERRVAEPRLPAPEDGRPGEGQRLPPDARHNGGGPPPGDGTPPPPRHAAPTGHAGQGDRD